MQPYSQTNNTPNQPMPQVQQPTSPPPPAAPPVMQTAPIQPVTKKIPFYRSYWIFAAIYLLLPPIFGIIILVTGDIFRKQKTGEFNPIGIGEKITLTIVVCIWWAYMIIRRL
jgi:hypothetical protein